jgi:16S rRNA (adenine1518-N6/adenine1519-N6)-dimethyltransferase
LKRRFAESGVRPDTRHGQNFLIDKNLLRVLVAAAELDPRDVVLEVGTGTGSLTALLAASAGFVVSIEIDSRLHQLAREELLAVENIVLLRGDALRNKNQIRPELLAEVEARLKAIPDGRFKLVANLPYNIATPIVSNLLLTPIVPERMVVTIQKELADRITAQPGTREYGALAAWIQSLCRAEVVRVLPPSVFWPRPQVHSAIIRILPDPDKRKHIADLEDFHAFLRSVFLHRRKLLRSGLVAAYKHRLAKPQVDRILAEAGLGPEARAEQLPVLQLQDLFHRVRGDGP